MTTTDSRISTARGMTEAYKDRPEYVVWPPTTKLRKILVPPSFPEGCLRDYKYWVYDHLSGEACIVLNDGHYFRILDPLDLVRFSDADINFLLVNQIRHDEEDEHVAKDFSRKASHILAKKIVANYNRIAGVEAAAEPDEVDPNEDII